MGRIFLTLFGLQFILLVIVLLFNWDALTTVGHSKAINPLWSFIFAPTAALSVLLVKILIQEAPITFSPPPLIFATALAALSYVVCGHFANDSRGIGVGFSLGELRVIPWIVFIITYWRLSNKGGSQFREATRLLESRAQSIAYKTLCGSSSYEVRGSSRVRRALP